MRRWEKVPHDPHCSESCRLVQGSQRFVRKIIPEQPAQRVQTPVSSAGCSRYRAGLCWKPVRGCAQHANESGTAESLMITRSLSLESTGDKGFLFSPKPLQERGKSVKKWILGQETGVTHHAVERFSDFCGGSL